MNLKPLVAACAAFVALASQAETQLTVVNFGGANGNGQKIAYFGPYEKASLKSWITARSATRPTSNPLQCMSAASAPSSGPP